MPSKRRPVKRSKGWEASLAHVVTIMRGPTLKTLAEARAYILTAVFYRQPRRAALMTSRRPLARSSWPFWAVTKMQLTKNNSNFRGCRASWKGVRN
jgi:hypothetical protein